MKTDMKHYLHIYYTSYGERDQTNDKEAAGFRSN